MAAVICRMHSATHCNMLYDVDFTRLALQLLPPVLRSRTLAAILHALIVPLLAVNDAFTALRRITDRRLTTTANVISLETALNAAFMLEDRQIYIDTPEEPENTVMHLAAEMQATAHMTFAAEGETPLTIRRETESRVVLNFYVMIPTFLCTDLNPEQDNYHGRNLNTIQNILSIYKPAGRTFGITLYDYE